ncbi:MAG: DUF5009 domain-containing protein [Bacteroidota bacterium]
MQKERIQSIDIFRGLTIWMMVFVNDLASVKGIPSWMKHVPAEVDGMTFVDVVFPAFLFIVGMAIPFAVERRLKGEPTLLGFWRHVWIRTLGLLVLGVYMVNSGEMNQEASLVPKSLWAGSLYIAVVLIWNRYPQSMSQNSKSGLKVFGALVLIVLYFLFRKGSGDQIQGMSPSWWGILGLIGWAYLISVALFMAAKKQLREMGIIFICMLFLLLTVHKYPDGLPPISSFLGSQSGHLVHSLLVLSGIMCSLILRDTNKINKPLQKVWGILGILLFGMSLAVLGYFTQPFGGISKIYATPAWALYSAAICCAIYALLYLIVDIKGFSRWANFLKPAGENPLLTYIIPPFLYAVIGFPLLGEVLNGGMGGIFRSVLFSFLILGIASWLHKKRVHLQL